MSVNYKTEIGYGYVISCEERAELLDAASCPEIADNISDALVCIDCYRDDSDYFLGVNISSVYEGEYNYLNDILISIQDNLGAYLSELSEILIDCELPMSDPWDSPELVIMHRIV